MRLLAMIVLAAGVCAQDRQAALGEHLASEFRRSTVPFVAVEPYVRAVAKQLTPPGRHWEFDVIGDDAGGRTFEPVVFPGYVFVPAKLLMMTGSEAELAGMLAHAAAHLLEPPSKLMVASRDDSVPFGFVAEARARELEADRQAVRSLANAGYNPQALMDYLRRVQPPASPKNSRLPALAERIAAMEGETAAIPPRTEWRESAERFADAQERARRLLLKPLRRPSLFR
jgi:predicted Zn-dependent protease